MLKFDITIKRLDGSAHKDAVEVPLNTRFKGVLNQARAQGMVFGFGMLSLNGTVIPREKMGASLEGRVTKGGTIIFEHRPRRGSGGSGGDSSVFDLDSLR